MDHIPLPIRYNYNTSLSNDIYLARKEISLVSKIKYMVFKEGRDSNLGYQVESSVQKGRHVPVWTI